MTKSWDECLISTPSVGGGTVQIKITLMPFDDLNLPEN